MANLPASIPLNVREKMKSMTPQQRQEVVDYYVRNDLEELRLKQQTPQSKTSIKPKEPALVNPGLISPYIRNPELAPNIPEQPPSNDVIVSDYINNLYSNVTGLDAPDSTPKSAFDQVLDIEFKNRNIESKYRPNVQEFLDNIGLVESDNIPTRTQNDDPKGNGRGKHQFEMFAPPGEQPSAVTARNRFFNWEKENTKIPIPEKDREELNKNPPDFSKLTEETQDIVAFINFSKHPTAPLTDIITGKVPQDEAWVLYHWAGDEKLRDEKRAYWAYKKDPTDPILAARYAMHRAINKVR